MSEDVDSQAAGQLVDKRRLKRRLTVWRLVAVAALMIAGLALFGRLDGLTAGPYVARLSVSDVILDDPWRDDALAEIADDDQARALVVRINSPGGTVVGGEALFHRLRQVAKNKPVVAVIGEMGTSAAYMTAMGADRIIARSGSVTGSIGVILQTADITGLLEKLGIKPEAIKSSPLKAQPSPFEPLTDEAREATAAVVRDIYEMFIDMVGDRRAMAREKVLKLADGRIFTGRQAVASGLIDGLGGEAEARDWLAETHGIPRTLPTREVEIDYGEEVWDKFFGSLVGKVLFSERLRLDGLVSVWHPVLR